MRLTRTARAVLGVLLMVSLSLFPRLLVAQDLDVASLVGKDWYGLYMNGQKAGYAMNALDIEDDGTVIVTEDARFRINMAGVPQDMQILTTRAYMPEGNLISVDYSITDPAGLKEFHAVVGAADLILKSTVGGQTAEERLPKPRESLKDVLKQAQLVGKSAKVGDEIAFSVFEPMYKQELAGTSRIEAVEDRVFEGAPTRVFRVKSTLPQIGIDSDAVVSEDGTVLEDVMGGVITMRIEPEAVAKDVNYNNDVIVSNAAMVDTPVANPRTRAVLRLRLNGPLTGDHMFDDERQNLMKEGESFVFTGRRNAVEGFQAVRIPIDDPAVAEWLKPTVFVQSDAPKLVEKARAIVGDTRDALEISNRLCRWVHDNVRTVFSAQLTNALEVLERLEGDCTEYSILFIGLARAAGLPAREVAGLIYMDGPQPGFYFHQWAKVWVGKWIDVDPTFNEPIADATHIKLAEGDLFEQARLIPVVGRIKIEVLDGGNDS